MRVINTRCSLENELSECVDFLPRHVAIHHTPTLDAKGATNTLKAVANAAANDTSRGLIALIAYRLSIIRVHCTHENDNYVYCILRL